jgi:SnoaL-like polyketide cyclase
VSRDANAACLAGHLAAERAHGMEATLATLHPECVVVDRPLGLRLIGRDGARRHFELWWSAFGAVPDDGTVHWVGDDLVVGEADFAGTHVGDFAGLAPTGRAIRLPFVVFVESRDGLLAGERLVYDLDSLLGQLDQPCFDPRVPVL